MALSVRACEVHHDSCGRPSAGRNQRRASALTRTRVLATTTTLAGILSHRRRTDGRGAIVQFRGDVADRVASNLGASACAREVLSRHGLLRAGLVDPERAALRLEAALGPRQRVNPALC